MREYAVVEVKERQLVKWTCAVCDLDFLGNDLEMQEAFRFSNVGGYGSIFGDGVGVYVDLCQHCVKKMLGEYLTII